MYFLKLKNTCHIYLSICLGLSSLSLSTESRTHNQHISATVSLFCLVFISLSIFFVYFFPWSKWHTKFMHLLLLFLHPSFTPSHSQRCSAHHTLTHLGVYVLHIPTKLQVSVYWYPAMPERSSVPLRLRGRGGWGSRVGAKARPHIWEAYWTRVCRWPCMETTQHAYCPLLSLSFLQCGVQILITKTAFGGINEPMKFKNAV